VPAAFLALCERVVLHRDPQRFALLYRLLWRLVHEPALRHDPLDADLQRARRMEKAVQREQHKMTAFVRFRPIERGPGEAPLHVAWFEPEQHVVEATAPFFARRFATLQWAILTPERSVRWDGERLHFGPGARREDAPAADAGEALWLTYYEHIFNPARLKRRAMEKEMPRRYWPNLPEARLIESLSAQAARRGAAMLARGASMPARKLPKAASTRVAPSGRARAAPGEHASAEGVPTEAAEGWRTLDELRAATDRCRECPIGEHATQSVFGEGPLHAPLMLVGEQPGDQEDLRGRPFVGPAGQLLDRALGELGWERERLYVTNAVKHFKFELRGTRRIHKTPGQREVAACLHWLESEIERVQPRALVALGATAARALMGRQVGITAERGRWLVREDGREVLITLHPSALLRVDPSEREAAYAAWVEDLRRASAHARRG
jgi:DNA polymerase